MEEPLFETLQLLLQDQDTPAELLLYLLDIAEVYASSMLLSASAPSSGKSPQAPLELYTSLAKLAQSNDRALVIATYTLIGALAMCEGNQAVFTRSNGSAAAEHATNILLKRALQLFVVNDSSLILPVLEFLYQHTSIPTNAAMLIQQPDLRNILKMLAHRIPEGSREEVWEQEVSGVTVRRGAKTRDNLRATYPILVAEEQEANGGVDFSPKLQPEQLQTIIKHSEPGRTIEWCVRHEPDLFAKLK